jgi:hypothetical protein
MIIAIPTFYRLTTLKQLFELAILLDTIMLTSFVAGLSFISLMLILDQGGTWYFPAIEMNFVFISLLYSTMVRVMLVRMEWTKWQIIAFKLSLMVNCLLYFVSGAYFIYIDFTYTNKMLISFDAKVHDFMLLFLFAMSGWLYELYNKMTDLDHTGDFKYVYRIKNVDANRPKRK